MSTNHRLERVGEEIKKQLSELIREEMKNPDVPSMTSILSVEVAKDLKHAKVHVSIYGDDEEKSRALKALRQTAGFLRFELGKRLMIRSVPEIHFELDESIAKSVEISRILKEMEKQHGQSDNHPAGE